MNFSHSHNLIAVWRITLFLGLVLFFASSCGMTQTSSPGQPANKTTAPRADAETTFLAVGDIMLSRGIEKIIERDHSPLAPFSHITELLDSTDFNFANFEAPISGNDSRMGKHLVFNVRKNDIEGILIYKFKIVGLANNHAFDQGHQGLTYTKSFLTERGILNMGTGESKGEAWQPGIITVNGIRIGFLAASYASVNDGGVTKNPYVARIEDTDEMKAAIADLKQKSDYIIVAMHAGIEYTRRPIAPQIAFAHAAIDAGADMVIGAHPHWIQTTEQYKGKYIFYSLGNFIFDQHDPETHLGLTLKIKLKLAGDRTIAERIELIPVVIEQLGKPRRATQQETDSILKKIDLISPILTSEPFTSNK